jgi:hypothetical protein
MHIINPLLFSPQVKNKPYKPVAENAFILENGASLQPFPHMALLLIGPFFTQSFL